MLSIRFSRIGKKKQPSYRIIILEKRKDPWDIYSEDLGYYNPKTKSKSLKKERIKYWLTKGAKPSDTVYNLLVDEKIITTPKVRAFRIKEKPVTKEKQT